MTYEAKWGDQTKSETRLVRGEVRREGQRAVTIEVRGSKSALTRKIVWAFEACGPGGLSSKSAYVFLTAEEAMEVATTFAQKILEVNDARG